MCSSCGVCVCVCVFFFFDLRMLIKSKSQPTFSFLAAVNHLSEPLTNETKVHFDDFKSSWFVNYDGWISIRFEFFCVSVSVACVRNYDLREQKTKL